MTQRILYDVVIVSIEANRVESIIGKGLREKYAEQRIITGLTRVNPARYFVTTVPAESHVVGDTLRAQ